MIETARAYLSAGLCPLPAILAEKRPALPAWKQYQQRLPTEHQLQHWFTDSQPICLLTGAVSGNLELIDFDFGGEMFDPWREMVEEAAPGLVERLVVERSQSGGRHVVYRCEAPIPGNQKLAQRIVQAPDQQEMVIDGKRYRPHRVGDGFEVTCTLIETRGEGGLFLCHPTPGYALEQGDLRNLPVLTEAERKIIIEAAWALNEAIPNVPNAAGCNGGLRSPGGRIQPTGRPSRIARAARLDLCAGRRQRVLAPAGQGLRLERHAAGSRVLRLLVERGALRARSSLRPVRRLCAARAPGRLCTGRRRAAGRGIR